MSVTQSYKTVTLTPDALIYVQLAVLTQMRADRAAKRTPGEEYDSFLKEQLETGVGAMLSLNAANTATDPALRVTNGMDKAEAMRLAAIAVRFMLRVEAIMGERRADVFLVDVLRDQVRVNPAGLRTALLFLENPK